MKRTVAILATTLVAASLAAGGTRPENRAAERRVLAYVNSHLEPGRPLVVSDLYNKVFTSSEDRQALNKLYNAFFRIPLFVANYQQRCGEHTERGKETITHIVRMFAAHDLNHVGQVEQIAKASRRR